MIKDQNYLMIICIYNFTYLIYFKNNIIYIVLQFCIFHVLKKGKILLFITINNR